MSSEHQKSFIPGAERQKIKQGVLSQLVANKNYTRDELELLFDMRWDQGLKNILEQKAIFEPHGTSETYKFIGLKTEKQSHVIKKVVDKKNFSSVEKKQLSPIETTLFNFLAEEFKETEFNGNTALSQYTRRRCKLIGGHLLDENETNRHIQLYMHDMLRDLWKKGYINKTSQTGNRNSYIVINNA